MSAVATVPYFYKQRGIGYCFTNEDNSTAGICVYATLYQVAVYDHPAYVPCWPIVQAKSPCPTWDVWPLQELRAKQEVSLSRKAHQKHATCYSIAYGWPMRWLKCAVDANGMAVHGIATMPPKFEILYADITIIGSYGKSCQASIPVPRTFPIHVEWLALVLNGICFGISVHAVLALMRWAMCRNRQRRRQCLYCGYSRVGLAGHACPECGGNP